MRLGDLVTGFGIQTPTGDWQSIRVCDITEDSRTALPGSLFVARGGLKADGRRFIASAIEAGATAILTDAEQPIDYPGVAILRCKDVQTASARLAERFYGNPSSKLDLVAVTGTNGKSTITFLIWRMLNLVDTRCGLIGTVLTDDGREVAPSSMTTPPAIELSRTMGSMVESGCSAAAMEASSHALDQRRVAALSIDIGVFTNLTGDHLDYHVTMDNYAASKARLFESLPKDGLAVVNAHDAWSERVTRGCAAPIVACRIVGESGIALTRSDFEATAQVLASGVSGMHLRLSGPWGTAEGTVPLIGAYNVMNVLQAAVCCHRLGVTGDALSELLPKLTAPPGRLEPVQVPGVAGPRVYVDYAHSDDSLRNVLLAARGAMATDPTAGRLWAVFGCGGDKDRTKRPRMGKAAAEIADAVIVTSDNPRSEQPGAIVKEILAGIDASLRDKVDVHVERDQAIAAAIQRAADNDVIVIAGKGHETEQIRSDGNGTLDSLHFDDREHARQHLAARAGRPVAT